MSDIRYGSKRKVIASAIFIALFLAEGCDNKEDGKKHLEKGIEYLNKGEYEKAKLELETSSQSDKDTAQTYYYLALLDEKNLKYKEMKENLTKTVELAPKHVEARIKLGNVLLLLSEPVKAQEQADYVLKEDGQNMKARILKASAFISQKKVPEALAILDDILVKNPLDTDALSLKALVSMQKNDLPMAKELIEAAIKTDQKNLALQLLKIQIHAKEKDFDAVIADYRQLIVLYPENKDFKVMLAKIYAQLDKKKEAEDLLRQLIAQVPDDIRAKILLLDFLSVLSTEKVSGQFHQYVEQYKNQPKILLELANWMTARKQFEEANKIFNQVIASEKDSDIAYAAKALLAKNVLDNKNYDMASKIVDEILEAKPDYASAKILKARLFIAKQLPDEAIEILNKLAFSRPNSDEILYLLGQSYLIKDNKQEADKNFAKALELNPINYEALVYVYDKALATNDIKFAKDILKKAIRYKPDNLILLEKLTKIHLSERNWDEAKVVVQQIGNVINPLAKDLAAFLQGQIVQGQGDYPKAIGIYKTLLAKYPENSDALVSLGRCYESLGKRGEMIGYLNEALAKNQKNISAGVLLAELYRLDKNYAKGVSLLNQLIQKDPNIPKLYVLLANTKLAENDNQGAVIAYQEGLKKNPESVELSLSLASLYERQGQHDLAIKFYEQLVEKNPRLDVAINNLASILSENSTNKEQLDKAEHLAEKFKDSEQSYFRDTYAWVLVKQGRIPEAVNILAQIVKVSPEEPGFRYHLGVAYHKNGDNILAATELKQALELAKTKGRFPEKQAVESLLAEITKSAN
ncbi:MAG: tetratricopeptide repeat protein [Methylovulum miyakonense]|uniref:tetratricopeptide repeat protein n=1 Tax=Methylovulum miyakonense TaxID=645578 RepID=UPI003BB67E06